MALRRGQVQRCSLIIVANIQVDVWIEAKSLDTFQISHRTELEQLLRLLVLCGLSRCQSILVVDLKVMQRIFF